MIKQIVYCDRCGKECEYVRNTLGFELQRHQSEIDLCQKCYASLNRWLKEKETASPTDKEVKA